MEATIIGFRVIKGIYRYNGKENGSYHYRGLGL